MKKMILRVVQVIVCIFALYGIYVLFMNNQTKSAEKKVLKLERGRVYTEDFQYNKNGGEPLILVDPDYTKTLFFIAGFRAQAPQGMYIDWFTDLHTNKQVNIIVPVYGLQSSPFKLRNREWYAVEDIRTVTQIYDVYTASLNEEHTIVTASMSFGTFPHSAVLKHAQRKPDVAVFMSPLNRGLEYKASGPVIYWLSEQSSWLQHILMYSFSGPPPGRASVWDIVNDEANKAINARLDVNDESNTAQAYQVELYAAYLEDRLIPDVKGMDIIVSWGDSDLFFSQDGFENFASLLAKNNQVEMVPLTDTGHMVLMDNGSETIKQKVEEKLLAE